MRVRMLHAKNQFISIYAGILLCEQLSPPRCKKDIGSHTRKNIVDLTTRPPMQHCFFKVGANVAHQMISDNSAMGQLTALRSVIKGAITSHIPPRNHGTLQRLNLDADYLHSDGSLHDPYTKSLKIWKDMHVCRKWSGKSISKGSVMFYHRHKDRNSIPDRFGCRPTPFRL